MSIPTPTPDELQRDLEVNTAFNTIMQEDEDAFWTRVETEYNNIKTTTEAFQRTVMLKKEVQRVSM